MLLWDILNTPLHRMLIEQHGGHTYDPRAPGRLVTHVVCDERSVAALQHDRQLKNCKIVGPSWIYRSLQVGIH